MRQMRQQQRRKTVSGVAHSISFGLLTMPRGMPSFCFKPFEEDNTRESTNGDVKKDFSHSHVNFTNFNHQVPFFR